MAEQPERVGGRPTKFTPELGRIICTSVELIGFEAVAAEKAGVHRQTVANWRERGQRGEPEFEAFARDLAIAKATWTQSQLAKVEDPRWLLERADREQFSAPHRHEMTGARGGAIEHDHKVSHSLSREQSVEIVSKILGVNRALVEGKFRGAPQQLEEPAEEG